MAARGVRWRNAGSAGMLFAAVLFAAVPFAAAPAAAGPLREPGDEPPPRRPSTLGASACAPAAVTPFRAVPPAQARLAPDRVWPLTKGAGVTVAVLSTGVSARTPTLAGAVLPGADVTPPTAPGGGGAGASRGGPADTDCAGDGTFLAGLIAARQAERVHFAGLAPQARILPIRVVTARGETNGDLVARGIRAAVDGGATIVVVPRGVEAPAAALESAVKDATGRGALIVAATGGPQDPLATSYPAAYPGVVAVAVADLDGAAPAGRPGRVDLVAPGQDIIGIGTAGDGHYVDGGVAAATALVAGAAALVRSYHPTLTPAQVRHRLAATADGPGRPVPDPVLGFGVVNPYPAVTAVLAEEWGDRQVAVRDAVRIGDPARPDLGPARVAYAVTAATVLAVAVATVVWWLLRHRRRLPSP